MRTITDNYTDEMVSVGFGQLHLMKGGAGTPLLLFQDDIGSPGWLPFYDDLAQHFTVYVPEHPGFGQSERPEWMRSVRDLALTHLWLLKTLQLDALTVVGLGFGGWVAAEMATMCQHQFERMILVGAAGVQPPEGEIVDQFLVSGQEYVKQCFHDLAKFESLYGKDPTPEQHETWEINREMTVRVAWKPYMFNQALPILLAGVDTPTLVLRGREDAIVPASCAQRYADTLPHAQLHVLDNCGHCADVEQPQALAALIVDFVSRSSPH